VFKTIYGPWSIVHPALLPRLEQMHYNGNMADGIARKPDDDPLAAQAQLDELERLFRAALGGDLADGHGALNAPESVMRIERGRSFHDDGTRVRCAYRDWRYSFYRSDTIEFRVVVEDPVRAME